MQSRSPRPRKSLNSEPAPPPGRRGRTGRAPRGGGGEPSIISGPREEPQLVSHAGVSLLLLALHTQIGFLRAAAGAKARGDGETGAPPPPQTKPRPRPAVLYLPGAPGPAVTASPLGAPGAGPAPRPHQAVAPRPAKSPSLVLGGGQRETGEVVAETGARGTY